MYTWIWRHLPGNLAWKFAQTAFLIAAVSALLLFVIFPWLDAKLPLDHVTINGR